MCKAQPVRARPGLVEGREGPRRRPHSLSTSSHPHKNSHHPFLQSAVVAAVRAAVTLEPGSPERAAAVAAIRAATNSWVAKYRRDNSFSGKPSYGNTYSALNAVAGHINSFGPEAALPKKRLERVLKELDDADKLIGRGR